MEGIDSLKGKRIAILGIGNILRCDDGIGPAVAQALSKKVKSRNALIIDCGLAIENSQGLLARFNPQAVIIVDAVAMHKPAGEFILCSASAIPYRSSAGNSNLPRTTHSLSLYDAVEQIRCGARIGCPFYLLAVQAKEIRDGEGLSRELEAAKKRIVQMLSALFN